MGTFQLKPPIQASFGPSDSILKTLSSSNNLGVRDENNRTIYWAVCPHAKKSIKSSKQ